MKAQETLAAKLDFRRVALRNQHVEGVVALADLPRVEQAVAGSGASPIVVSLNFHEDRQRRVRVEGRIDATLLLECQRCLEAFEQALTVEVAGVIAGSDDMAASVPREDEPIEVEGELLDVYALVEDELLLGMPLVARCGRPECRQTYATKPPEQVQQRKRKDNPFAVLKDLKGSD